ncbi:hypothetical protein Tco_1161061, partial [Tanacetum coccineum]
MGILTIGQTGELLPLPPVASICKDLQLFGTVERDDEIKVLGEINLELQSGTHKVLGEVNVELKFGTKKLRDKLSHEEDSEEEALEEFNSTLDNVLEKLSQEKDSPDDFYGFMYDTDDDANDPLHETEDFFVGLDQSIQVVVVQNNVHEDVAEEVTKMANDQAEALSDQEVTDECLDDEHV